MIIHMLSKVLFSGGRELALSTRKASAHVPVQVCFKGGFVLGCETARWAFVSLVIGVGQHVHLQHLFPLETLLADIADERMVVTVLENVQSQFSIAPELCVTELTVKRSAGGSMTPVKVLQHFCFSLSFAGANATIEAYVLCIVNVLQQFGNLQEL